MTVYISKDEFWRGVEDIKHTTSETIDELYIQLFNKIDSLEKTVKKLIKVIEDNDARLSKKED